jgi:hypothetical protein
MKKYGIILLLLLSNLYLSAQTRMIVMSDIGGSAPDDTQSLVHLFVSLDQVELEDFISEHSACSIIVPKNAANHTIHIILRVVDDGVPVLTSYKRILLKVLPL